MKTVSDRKITTDQEWAGPVDCDASALAKIYIPEAGSDELDALIRGRRDLMVSDLAITEIVSAAARRRRERALSSIACARLHRQILRDLEQGFYIKVDLMPETHREAERLLLALDFIALRAADALHLAQATLAGAPTILTYDLKLAEAARKIGLNALP